MIPYWLPIWLLVAVNLIFFWRTLFYFYAVDDLELSHCGCKVPEIIETPKQKMCKKCGLRERIPVGFWKMVWQHFKGDTQYTKPKLAHSLRLATHIIAVILIYFAFGADTLSFFVALLFSIHPLATQGSSVWISGSGYATTNVLVLLMWWLKPVAWFFFFPMFAFSYAGITAPLMFIGSPYWFYIALFLPFVIFWKKIYNIAAKYKWELTEKVRPPIEPKNAILYFKSMGYYFMLALFPTSLGVHHTYLQTYGATPNETEYWLSLKDKFFWLGIALFLGTVALCVVKWDSPVAFGMYWFFLFLLPWANIHTTNMLIAERYATISLIGFLYAFVACISYIPDRALMWSVYVFFFASYLWRMNDYIRLYQNILACTEENVRNFPESHHAWVWKGGIERNLELHEKAFESWLVAWRIRPYDFRINNNLAAMLCQKGQFTEAEKFLEMAEKSPVYKIKEGDRDKLCAAMRENIALCRENLQKRISKSLQPYEPCFCGSGKKFKWCHGTHGDKNLLNKKET